MNIEDLYNEVWTEFDNKLLNKRRFHRLIEMLQNKVFID